MKFLNMYLFKSIPFFTLIGSFLLLCNTSCQSQQQTTKKKQQQSYLIQDHLKDPKKKPTNNPTINSKMDSKNNIEYWRKKLTPEEYYILREKGTERPFTGKLNKVYDSGAYTCKGCGQLLFESTAKFDSGSGWPSFDAAIPKSITYIKDRSHGMARTEIVCSNCQGHLGHVFDDGPRETTGKRYCVNSLSLNFFSNKE